MNFNINGSKVGTWTLTSTGQTTGDMTFTPTGGSQQGPWSISYVANGGAIGKSTISMSVPSLNKSFVAIAGNFTAANGNGGGKLTESGAVLENKEYTASLTADPPMDDWSSTGNK